MDIIFLKPVFKQMIWGGERLRRDFGYEIPGNHTGECWAISAHPQGDCTVSEGKFAGMRLSELFRSHRELFGDMAGERFPLLVKLIDAREDLSIQVHPDDAYAAANENGSLGKMECWYILDCEKDATIVIGHHAGSRQELETMVREGRWKELIREIPVKKGDFFQINPGCVHAIKGGTLILETQQNSDITYRLYDYDRLQDGKLRPLHIKQSLEVIQVPFVQPQAGVGESKTVNAWLEQLVTCQYYTVWKGELKGKRTIVQDQKFMLGSVIEGSAKINNRLVKKGTHFILPYGIPPLSIEGDGIFIFSAVSES